jgi:hypothetical protein
VTNFFSEKIKFFLWPVDPIRHHHHGGGEGLEKVGKRVKKKTLPRFKFRALSFSDY